MTPLITASSSRTVTFWTLARSGQQLMCVLLRQPSGGYVVRLTHGDGRIVDEQCDSPQHALARSLDAVDALLPARMDE
jgi:hypothetical protein